MRRWRNIGRLGFAVFNIKRKLFMHMSSLLAAYKGLNVMLERAFLGLGEILLGFRYFMILNQILGFELHTSIFIGCGLPVLSFVL